MTVGKVSKIQVKEEIKKCGRDPVYFIKNYCKISHPERGLIPFKTYKFQDDLVDDFEAHRFSIVLKARQLGISTVVAGYIAWLLMFRREKSVVVISTKFDVAANLVRKVKAMINHLPKWIKLATIKVNNQTSFELSNGSWIKASSTSQDAGRSEALSLLVIDEAAFVEGLDELWKGIFPTLSTGGSCIALSTPNGVGNWFHETYTNAIAGSNDFYPITLPWSVHPERDMEWFEQVTRNLSRRDVAQEHECFTGDTKIFTSLGFKNMEDIRKGDLVLTHKGRFRPVVDIRKKNSANVFSVKTFLNRKETKMTGEHPLLTENKEWVGLSDINRDVMVCSSPKIKEINDTETIVDLKKYVVPEHFSLKEDGDKIYINDRRHKTRHNRYLKVDYDFGYFVGLFLSEGSIHNNGISFSFNYPDEMNGWVDKLCSIVEDKFGYTNFTVYNKGKSGSLCINSSIINDFIKHIVNGHYSYEKHLSEEGYRISNKNYLKGIIDGIFDGDGCIKEIYDKTINITSEKMIYDIKYICNVLGLGRNSVRKNGEAKVSTIMGRKVNVREQYVLKLLQTRGIMLDKVSSLCEEQYFNEQAPHNRSHNEDEEHYLTSLVSREKLEGIYEVYDLEVEEDHSFTTEHFVAHNCSFNMSGESVIHPEDLDKLRSNVVEPKYRTGFDRNYWIWEEYNPQYKYMVVADVARGDGVDNSAFHVMKIETMEQVAEYQGKVNLDMFSNMLNSVGREYGNALVVVENLTVGFNVLEKLINNQYPNLYYSIKGTHEFIDGVEAEYVSNSVPGFITSSKTRPVAIAKLEEFIRNRVVKIRSMRIVEELATFVWNNGRAMAQRNKHDDLVMSMAIACWIRDTALTTSARDIEYSKALVQSVFLANTKMSTAVPGQMGYKKNLDFSSNSAEAEARRQHEIYSWLYKG